MNIFITYGDVENDILVQNVAHEHINIGHLQNNNHEWLKNNPNKCIQCIYEEESLAFKR